MPNRAKRRLSAWERGELHVARIVTTTTCGGSHQPIGLLIDIDVVDGIERGALQECDGDKPQSYVAKPW